jgi:hypothetical protein
MELSMRKKQKDSLTHLLQKTSQSQTLLTKARFKLNDETAAIVLTDVWIKIKNKTKQ